MKSCNKNGFSLIEVLAAMVIITVVTAATLVTVAPSEPVIAAQESTSADADAPPVD